MPKALDRDLLIFFRTFRIACADHGTHFLAPGIALITQVAPLAQVQVWDLTDRWMEELKNGDIDAVVSPMPNVPRIVMHRLCAVTCP